MKSSGDIKQIIEEYEPLINRFFHGRLSVREDAEDLAQDAVCSLITGIFRFKGDSSLSSYVYGICRNTLFHYYRRKKRDIKLNEKIQVSGNDLSSDFWKDLFHDLSLSEQRLFRMYYREKLKIADISEILMKPQGTVKYELYCLRIKLKKIIVDE